MIEINKIFKFSNSEVRTDCTELFNTIDYSFQKLKKLINICIHLIQSKKYKKIIIEIEKFDFTNDKIISIIDNIKFAGILNKFVFVVDEIPTEILYKDLNIIKKEKEMLKVGDFIYIQDSTTNEILMSGTISKITNNPAGYSIDGILFMNPNSSKLKINKTYSLMKQNICFKDLITENRYKIYKHNNIDNTFEYDFFMWNEIEPEVKKICELLNQIDGMETYSSCSGHGKIPPYVDFYIHDYNKFWDLLDFLHDSNIPSKTNKHNDIYTKHRFIVGAEGHGTCHLESTEINYKFEDLCIVLKRYIIKQKLKT